MDIQRAHDVVYQAWVDRAALVLETAGWHHCTPACNMQCLRAYACLEGNHAISTDRCPDHPNATPVLVRQLYVCTSTGRRHVCGTPACTIDQGICVLTGAPVVQHAPAVLSSRQPNRRRTRRRGTVYTQEQSARAFVYDLLFSKKRLVYEAGRRTSVIDLSRRVVQRYVRQAIRDRKPLHMQAVVDILQCHRDRLRPMTYVRTIATPENRKEVCVRVAGRVTSLWHMIAAHVTSTYSFETAVTAILYIMRRGMAYDGVMVVPEDAMLRSALPDAHAIREFGIHRRQFTQLKNQVSEAIIHIVDTGVHTAVEIADCYSNAS